jgi:Na+-translocating ferredoxin:NAD+ oxidoreductase RNF subunit RnfB
MSAGLSRRKLFSLFTRPLRPTAVSNVPARSRPAEAAAPSTVPRVAVIQGRFCLAYTSFCSVCVERCPVPGALPSQGGIPMVAPEICTGCGVCQEVCPAPRNAVLLIPRRPRIQPPHAQPRHE